MEFVGDGLALGEGVVYENRIGVVDKVNFFLARIQVDNSVEYLADAQLVQQVVELAEFYIVVTRKKRDLDMLVDAAIQKRHQGVVYKLLFQVDAVIKVNEHFAVFQVELILVVESAVHFHVVVVAEYGYGDVECIENAHEGKVDSLCPEERR